MKQIARTHLVEYAPYPHRNERCSIGFIVRLPDGRVQAYPASNLKKARSINPACNVDDLRAGLGNIAADIEKHPSNLFLYEHGPGGILLNQNEGQIAFADEEELEQGIAWSLNVAVEPMPATAPRERAATSRLFLEIKQSFTAYGWLAKPGQSIKDHLIVPRFPIIAEEGLSVDFALKNGVLHCLQTLDYRPHNSYSKADSQAKLLTLGLAPKLVDENAKGYAVLSGASIKDAQATIKLAERVADDLFIHEDPSDMTRLYDILADALGKPVMPSLSAD